MAGLICKGFGSCCDGIGKACDGVCHGCTQVFGPCCLAIAACCAAAVAMLCDRDRPFGLVALFMIIIHSLFFVRLRALWPALHCHLGNINSMNH